MLSLPDNLRMIFAEQAAYILSVNSSIEYLDFDMFNGFSKNKDKGEGAVVVSALSKSKSLFTITHFRCSKNASWFSVVLQDDESEIEDVEGKESNVELLCDAIRVMSSLKYLNLARCFFSTEHSDKVLSAILAN